MFPKEEKPERESLDDGVVLLLVDQAEVEHQLDLVAHHVMLNLHTVIKLCK